ncbi:MCE family protein [Nocardia cyriacigeorgica]|uniref:MCE family protein n=1 Tax=Nocardia cyriacigeorgica TaxID=135487 RepID=UPI002454958C|nr:MCE family protein [Nocardia cyriacigeorgica]
MKSVPALLVRISLFAGAMVALLTIVFATIAHPVHGQTDIYTATFTDANGLHAGDDVRMRGVAVGKVIAIELAGARARVEFSVQHDHLLFSNTVLAIRFQNLVGQRYLDVRQPSEPGDRQPPGSHIDADRTSPAFDITNLFNSFRPVLAEFRPEDLNQFALSMQAILDGEGSGIGGALDAIGKLGQYAVDRQSLVSMLVRGLADVAQRIGGKSGNAISLLTQLSDLLLTLQQNLDGLIDFGYTIPPLLTPVHNALVQLGVQEDTGEALEHLLRNAFATAEDGIAVLESMPGLLQGLSALPSPATGVNMACSRGVAAAPIPFQVLIDGQRIVLCSR